MSIGQRVRLDCSQTGSAAGVGGHQQQAVAFGERRLRIASEPVAIDVQQPAGRWNAIGKAVAQTGELLHQLIRCLRHG